jgi:hypothetical protein
MLLAAPTAMRAHDLLVRRALETFHPLALARILVSPEEFRQLVHQVLLDLRHPLQPLAPTGPPEARASVAWSLAAWRKTVEEFVRRAELSPEELLAPPTPSEPDHVSYCPRCLTQYIVPEGVCAECGGLPLERLPHSTRPSSRAR